eukprot:83258-Rhodomonas_salina.4
MSGTDLAYGATRHGPYRAELHSPRGTLCSYAMTRALCNVRSWRRPPPTTPRQGPTRTDVRLCCYQMSLRSTLGSSVGGYTYGPGMVNFASRLEQPPWNEAPRPHGPAPPFMAAELTCLAVMPAFMAAVMTVFANGSCRSWDSGAASA